MKLRIQSNSVRVRMNRLDLAELLERGLVRGTLCFGPGSTNTFTYAVMIGAAPPGRPRADYSASLLVITIDPVAAQVWAAGERVGFDEEQAVGDDTVRVILEKDFGQDRPAEDAGEEAWAFSHPSVMAHQDRPSRTVQRRLTPGPGTAKHWSSEIGLGANRSDSHTFIGRDVRRGRGEGFVTNSLSAFGRGIAALVLPNLILAAIIAAAVGICLLVFQLDSLPLEMVTLAGFVLIVGLLVDW